eukprot:241607-Rhodomonas_salina.1
MAGHSSYSVPVTSHGSTGCTQALHCKRVTCGGSREQELEAAVGSIEALLSQVTLPPTSTLTGRLLVRALPT